MRNLILSALSAGLLFAAAPATPADAAVSANINLSFGNTPRYYFARQPRTILIPDTRVYYVSGMDDYDMFQCDGMWYIDDGGYWYRAPSYRGPFVSVSYASVPTVIMNVPSAYAHQPYRPGMWRSTSRSYGGGSAYYRGGSSDYRSGSGYNRGAYGADQRWQDRQRSSQTWQQRQRSDRNWSRDDDRGDNDRDHDRDHGNGNNHGNRGNGHGHGRGRGHDKG
ncbi:MAG TPA: hypothetical protein VGR66_07820 [Candidatus Eisenbacteria bacterium]|jgi:hypothetical protein|nr:hypothetical protein [Candidatus Eisenbacteria bacterium]